MKYEKMIATREGFGEEIVALGQENQNILVVDADIGKSCKTGAFRKALPDVSYKIGVRRLKHANDVGAEVLLVACPHCKDMFAETKTKSGINIEPVHILEVVAYCMGIEV